MERECVFRVEVEGRIFRVVKYPKKNRYGAHLFKIEHNRRVISKEYRMCELLMIEECLRYAFRCDVNIRWGIML